MPKRKTRNSSDSHSANREHESHPDTQLMLTRSASDTYKSDHPDEPRSYRKNKGKRVKFDENADERRSSLKTSHSRKHKGKCVRFDKNHTYEIEQIYTPDEIDITMTFSPEEIEKIEEKIREKGIICYEKIYDMYTREYKSRLFITDKEVIDALNGKKGEMDAFGRWSIHNVDDTGKVTWCTTLGKVCLYGGLFVLGSFVAKSLGGKKKSKKTKTRKIRRK